MVPQAPSPQWRSCPGQFGQRQGGMLMPPRIFLRVCTLLPSLSFTVDSSAESITSTGCRCDAMHAYSPDLASSHQDFASTSFQPHHTNLGVIISASRITPSRSPALSSVASKSQTSMHVSPDVALIQRRSVMLHLRSAMQNRLAATIHDRAPRLVCGRIWETSVWSSDASSPDLRRAWPSRISALKSARDAFSSPWHNGQNEW